VDLSGDGHADILITEDNVFTWHLSLAEEGFGSAAMVTQPFDEEKGPRLVLADGAQSIFLADLSGDGLTDLARIRNGEVCYWPSLGYGRFGAKVTMDDSPWFDSFDLFDQGRVRLADIDGSGTTDIIYLHRNRVAVYRNQAGNSWGEAEEVTSLPHIDSLSTVQALDLLG
ncbi:VCBS repeat-containing protein, partial [bacterium]|nr:VCBS repeat-containing protein [bacterium]